MNYRSKTTAMVLCFFFGLIGAHWFYLGRWRWGRMYLAAHFLTWPITLLLTCSSTLLGSTALGISWLMIGALVMLIAWLCAGYDLFCLLAIHPKEFDRQFNS